MCEIKFDGKIRAMEIFMDTNFICKVKSIKQNFVFLNKEFSLDCCIDIE
jgi:hypothetical protein